MHVYRITTPGWSETLSGSGYPARWNLKDRYVLYTASSASLACLENLVHRKSIGMNSNFVLMTIQIPDNAVIEYLDVNDLFEGWRGTDTATIQRCQAIADRWYHDMNSLVLQVPSAIIASEQNYLINTKHPDFSDISIVKNSPFLFDQRL